jgi:hypothetical protein
MMHSWRDLNPHRFRPANNVTSAFLRLQVEDFRSAGQYVSCLPYARNAHPEDPLVVLIEKRGTCSTKHALLRRLALEQDLNVKLVLGIYEMTAQNTPGVGHVLARYGLAILPEAHCYLRMAGGRIDVTRAIDGPTAEPISRFLYEEEIDPAQITGYKTGLHKRFLTQWIIDNGGLGGLSLSDLWLIREECIASLSR